MRFRLAVALSVGMLMAASSSPLGSAGARAGENATTPPPVDLSSCPRGDPGGVILICGDVPEGYVAPQAPAVPDGLEGKVFVVFPSIVPDEGEPCPLPQELGPDVLGTACGPVPADLVLPLPPAYDGTICAKAEAKLVEMKSEAVAAGVKDVSSSFPDHDPGSCRVWFPPSAPEPGMRMAVVRFTALDPAQEVPPVVVELGSQT